MKYMIFISAKFGLKHELQSCDYLKNYDGNISRQQIEPSDAKDFQETLKGNKKIKDNICYLMKQ